MPICNKHQSPHQYSGNHCSLCQPQNRTKSPVSPKKTIATPKNDDALDLDLDLLPDSSTHDTHICIIDAQKVIRNFTNSMQHNSQQSATIPQSYNTLKDLPSFITKNAQDHGTEASDTTTKETRTKNNFTALELDPNVAWTKKTALSFFRNKALECHPDKIRPDAPDDVKHSAKTTFLALSRKINLIKDMTEEKFQSSDFAEQRYSSAREVCCIVKVPCSSLEHSLKLLKPLDEQRKEYPNIELPDINWDYIPTGKVQNDVSPKEVAQNAYNLVFNSCIILDSNINTGTNEGADFNKFVNNYKTLVDTLKLIHQNTMSHKVS